MSTSTTHLQGSLPHSWSTPRNRCARRRRLDLTELYGPPLWPCNSCLVKIYVRASPLCLDCVCGLCTVLQQMRSQPLNALLRRSTKGSDIDLFVARGSCEAPLLLRPLQ